MGNAKPTLPKKDFSVRPVWTKVLLSYSARKLKNEMLPKILTYFNEITDAYRFYKEEYERLKAIEKKYNTLLRIAKNVRKPLTRTFGDKKKEPVKGDLTYLKTLRKEKFVAEACDQYYREKVNRDRQKTVSYKVIGNILAFNDFLKERNLDYNYYKLLYVIYLHEWFVPKDAFDWGFSRATVKKLMKKMEVTGLIESIDYKNISAYRITEQGKHLILIVNYNTTFKLNKIKHKSSNSISFVKEKYEQATA